MKKDMAVDDSRTPLESNSDGRLTPQGYFAQEMAKMEVGDWQEFKLPGKYDSVNTMYVSVLQLVEGKMIKIGNGPFVFVQNQRL